MSDNSEGVSTSQVLGEYKTALFEEPANNGGKTGIATLVRSLVDTMGRMETRLSKIERNTNALITSIDTQQVEDVSIFGGVSIFGDIERADNSYLHFRSHGR